MFPTKVFLAFLVSSATHCSALPKSFHSANAAVQADYSLIERTIFNGEGHHYLVGRELDENGALICGDNLVCADGSCCGPNSRCGYGPEICGTGCKNGCDATAMCGKYSADGKTKCGMNLCCGGAGWCGTADAHCKGEVGNECQQGFGSCSKVPPPSCGTGSGTSRGRTIGYYQSWNVRDRACMKIAPKDLKTEAYTHIYFSFASIDPNSFKIAPANPADVAMYTEFTALKSSKLQTWIAIGGYDFSDPGPTHTTWSDVCSTAANRAAFISSLIPFMDQYGFQGVDIDWEYPGDPKRGGKPADTANFVLLLKEMRAAFGTKYGITMAIAPDYWYLRWFDAKAMEPYVDWFGFMAYDLHGSWDSDVMTLGSIVRGQADIREIKNNTMPLWFAGLNPQKLNFGLANYGRGYTLADPNCNSVGCKFIGASKKSRCTGSDGVMSLTEINQFLVKDQGIQPRLNPDSMMMEITWDDQWIGYDDEQSFELKRQFADSLCFGGTMYWSIDFNSGAGEGGLEPEVTTDGTCGPQNGQKVCGNGFGDCCSPGGWCGSTDAHCGSGCQSGKCLTNFETSDGTCGAMHGNSYCGNWEQGPCCSSSGFCGNSPAHCSILTGSDGTTKGGCQSGCDGNGFPIKQPINSNPGKWEKAQCTEKVITDAAIWPKDRWDGVDTSTALDAAFSYWGTRKSGKLTFAKEISNYFNGPEQMGCESINTANGCNSFLECDDTNHPAGYLILNAFVSISNYYNNFYFAIDQAHALVGSTISSVQGTFANVKNSEKALQIMLDVLGLGFGVFAASGWARLKPAPYFQQPGRGIDFDTYKDTLNTLVSNGITIIKDTQVKDKTLSVQNALATNVALMASGWYKAAESTLKSLFDGSDDSMKTLKSMIDGGKLQDFIPPTAVEIKDTVIRSMYSFLIPMAWSAGGDGHAPFILDPNTDCDTAAKWDDDDHERILRMKRETAAKSGMCLNNRVYYLVSAQGKRNCLETHQGTVCNGFDLFSMLPGITTLDGSKWSGINRGHIIEGSMNSWTFNGKKNGLKQNDEKLVSRDNLNSMVDLMITAPGVFVIPVCSQTEAYVNWAGQKTGLANYPCN
ncbi:hypothetical protein ONS95_014088 [Cadophora gregata]|uniref:uncharacterized protein n=2 Tax=Cadophora gregata TaxID=51156 RepID=UPI0026DABD27|nr:uncharacterized protein ONS95_014088 [Cadophora gregata]KAK0114603.1 hypothetical protein ONS95_014088 [Cadophora gregata]